MLSNNNLRTEFDPSMVHTLCILKADIYLTLIKYLESLTWETPRSSSLRKPAGVNC